MKFVLEAVAHNGAIVRIWPSSLPNLVAWRWSLHWQIGPDHPSKTDPRGGRIGVGGDFDIIAPYSAAARKLCGRTMQTKLNDDRNSFEASLTRQRIVAPSRR